MNFVFVIINKMGYAKTKNDAIQEFISYSSMIVAKALAHYLAEHGLASAQRQGEHEFLVSDITPSFEKAAELFFGRKVPLEKHILWE